MSTPGISLRKLENRNIFTAWSVFRIKLCKYFQIYSAFLSQIIALYTNIWTQYRGKIVYTQFEYIPNTCIRQPVGMTVFLVSQFTIQLA